MTFSSKVKYELYQNHDSSFCCNTALLASLIQTNGTIHLSKNTVSLRITTENAGIARLIFKLLKDIYDVQPEVMVRKNQKLHKKNSYYIVLSKQKQVNTILINLGIITKNKSHHKNISHKIDNNIIKSKCCKRAYIKGVFLASGSLSDPEKAYHLELVIQNEVYAKEIRDLLLYFDIKSKIILRKENFVVYIKESEQIIRFLNIVGAHGALLELENIRIYKEVRNNVNRIVNCETANLGKTINASVRQIENINYIKDTIGLEKIQKNLREIAELRLNYRDANLKELGSMLNPPIGKSGVYHRLKKLEKIAEDLKVKKG